MTEPFSDKQQLKAFINAAQYIAGLTSGQDIWEEAGKVLLRFFDADFAAFGRYEADGNIDIGYRLFSDGAASVPLLEQELKTAVRDVFESGFLTFVSLPFDPPITVGFFPVLHQNRVVAVMIVGQLSTTRLQKEVLDLYLAVAGFIGSTYSRNISYSEMERRVLERTAQLTAANEELEAFAYSVSHDLRAPLRHMAGFAKLLQKRIEGLPDEKNIHYTNMIEEAAKRMGMLIDDLLSFSRTGRVEMRKVEFSMKGLMLDSIRDLGAETMGRVISWDIGELPSVWGDPSLLKLVCDNLLSNAIKFTRTRPRAEIRIGYKDDRDEVIFFVRDNGVGFDMGNVDRLFGVFHRLHNQDEFEGTGIGLANVRRIISRHGGRTWAEGSTEEGAAFYFTLLKTR